jgi:hypothetical protein
VNVELLVAVVVNVNTSGLCVGSVTFRMMMFVGNRVPPGKEDGQHLQDFVLHTHLMHIVAHLGMR